MRDYLGTVREVERAYLNIICVHHTNTSLLVQRMMLAVCLECTPMPGPAEVTCTVVVLQIFNFEVI